MSNILEKKWSVIFKLNQKIMNLEEDLKKSAQTISFLKANGGAVRAQTKKLQGLEALKSIDFPAIAEKRKFTGHRDAVTCLANHSTESFLVTGSSDSTLRVYDVELNSQVALLRGHTHSVNGVDWFKNTIVSCASDMTVRLWKSRNKQNSLDFEQFHCVKTLVGHDHSVSQIKVLGSSQYAVSVSRDCSLKFWDLEQQMCKRTLIDDEHEWLRCVDANESYLVAAGNDTRVWAYDLKKILSNNSEGKGGSKLAEETMVGNFPAHENVIEQLSIGYRVENKKKAKTILGTSCEHICVTASRDKQIKVFNILNGDCLLSFSGHENWVKDVQIIPEKSWILSVGEDKTLRIWNIEKKKQIFMRKGIHEHFVNRMIFDLSKMMITTGSVDKTCKIWGLMSENEFRMNGLS